jgi:hypothetical protein
MLTAFLPLAGIYEPSAIQQLPNGRFLVVEDEKQFPLALFSIRADGTIVSQPVERDADDPLGKLDDLEGLTADAVGNIYAITSHSRTGDGDEKKSRNKLVRFRIEGNRIVAAGVCSALRPALVAAHPVLAQAAAILDVKAAGGLNIEAIEIDPATQHLLVGFRGPLIEGKALLARIENPAGIFDRGEPPRIAATFQTLDLGGHGARGLSWVPALNGFLLVSGPVAREPTQFKLWFWSGRHGDPARSAAVPGLPGFEQAEGITPAVLDGRQGIIIVSDDGNRAEGRPARYLRIDAAQLIIA